VNRGLVWIAALAPQVALVAGIAITEEVGRLRGTEVVLEVRAYDPIDLLAGRYIHVPLAISRLPGPAVAHPDPIPEVGSTVFVRLAKGDPYWTAAEVRTSLPGSRDPALNVYLRGQVDGSWSSRPTGNLHLKFDLDRFYISEDAEDPSVWQAGEGGRHRLAVVARITPSGKAHLVDLLVDGKPYAEWNREAKRKSGRG
jgi:uncharacterized membrane-anchored protein